MKALRLQVLHTCDGSPSLSVNTTRNSDPKRPRRLVCFASTVNRLVACFASSSERQKRQRYFKAILLHAEVVYFPRIFPLYLPLTYLDKLYGKCTDLYAHAQTVDTRRSSPIFQAPGYEARAQDELFKQTYVTILLIKKKNIHYINNQVDSNSRQSKY